MYLARTKAIDVHTVGDSYDDSSVEEYVPDL